MDHTKLTSVKLALMERHSANKNQTTDYTKKASSHFRFEKVRFWGRTDPKEHEDFLASLLESILDDLLTASWKGEVDSLGVWIEYDGKEYENSIKLTTLEGMGKLHDGDVSPVHEFFKMTLADVYYPSVPEE